jgi:hypothetical protein
MISKYMFGGLTIVLMVALGFLVIRGRKMEKQQERQKTEVIRESKPSPTRVLTPRKLKIVQAKMALFRQSSDKAASQSAQHEIEIRNLGQTSYSGIQILFKYLNSKGKTIATKQHSINKVLSPGGVLLVSDIKIADLPVSIADGKVIIISADLGEAP